MSGFDVSGWKSKKYPKRASKAASKKNRSKAANTTKFTAKNESDGDVQVHRNSKISLAFLGLVFALVIGTLLQSVMVKPISTDFVLKPGDYKSKCGIFGYVPLHTKDVARDVIDRFPFSLNALSEILSCENEFLRVNHDGTATFHDSENQVTMVLKGEARGNSGGGS